MDTQEKASGAPSTPTMRAPVAPYPIASEQPVQSAAVDPTEAPVKPAKAKRVRNRATGAKRGPRPLTEAEKAAKAAARQTAEQEQAQAAARRDQARKNMARIAAIGALTPQLLEPGEIEALSRFVLATVTTAPAVQA